jgi:hypothetical protein
MAEPNPDGLWRVVIAAPICQFCYDRDATHEVTTVQGWTALLCDRDMRRVAAPGSRPRRLVVGPARSLPSVAEVQAFVAAQRWTRAQPTFRGRPQAPHEYCLIWDSTDWAAQLRVLAWLREYGESRPFPPRATGRHRKIHHYWQYGGYEYWAMPPRETILNRRHLDWSPS